MTLTLNLGVIDVPYALSSYETARSPERVLGAAKRGKVAAPRQNQSGQTTGDVGEILEAKYHIMQTFIAVHEKDIAADLADSLQGALENMLTGAAPRQDAYAEATSSIEARMKQFLSNQEMDGRTDGVPTQAAQAGISHRFRHPYAKRAARPSFIDTGLFEANLKAWVE